MNNLQLTELQPLILQWGKDKNLLFLENAPKQRLKLIEECGELASAILKNDVKLQKDAIGDIFVVLTILAEQLEKKQHLTKLPYERVFVNEYVLINRVINYSDAPNVVSYLQTLSLELELDLTECANIAWNEIKNRTGNTINGTFIKDK